MVNEISDQPWREGHWILKFFCSLTRFKATMANDDPWGNDTAAADSADPWGSGGGDGGGDTDVNENVKGGDFKCYNCGEEGHSSKDCSKAETCR